MRHMLAWFSVASCALVLNACYEADGGSNDDDDDGSGGTGLTSGVGGSSGSSGTGGSGGSSGSGGAPEATCAAAASFMTQCGLLQGPLPDCDDTAAADRCLAGCTVAATCTELADVYCNGIMNSFYSCGVGCSGTSQAAPSSGAFYCEDGQAIPLGYVCDGYTDCSTGEDEVNCTTEDFICADGSSIPESYVCDNYDDCEGGEDELDCGTDGLICPPQP